MQHPVSGSPQYKRHTDKLETATVMAEEQGHMRDKERLRELVCLAWKI